MRRCLLPALALVLFVLAPAGTAANAAAAETGAISGTVTEAAVPHNPIAGIEVCAVSKSATEIVETTEAEGEGTAPEGPPSEAPSCVKSASDGDYTISGLISGQYLLRFSPPFSGNLNYIPQFYEGAATSAAAKTVTLAAPASIAGIDAELVVGGQISGTVTAAATGAGVERALICAVSVSNPEIGWCGTSGTGGAYTVSGLTTGEYHIFFFDPGYELQVYGGTAAAVVDVTQDGVTSGIDSALQPRQRPSSPGTVPLPSAGGAPAGRIPGESAALTILSSKLIVSKGVVRVRVRCSGAPCDGSIVLGERNHDEPGKRTTRLVGGLPVAGERTLAKARYSLAPGRTAVLSMRITRKGRKLLARMRQRRLMAEIYASVEGGVTVVRPVRIVK